MNVTAPPATRHLLRVADLSADQISALLDLAAVMKRHPLAWRHTLEGRAVACWFEEPSTRARVSFQVAVHRLGALPIMLRPDELQLGRGEPIADTARVLSAYCDAIVARTPAHRDVLELVEHASVPVVNALSDRHHPCHALADCLTLHERFGHLDGLTVAYVGDCTNVTHSLIEAAVLTGMIVHIASPAGHSADPGLMATAGTAVRTFDEPREAVAGASAVYTDAAAAETGRGFQVTAELMRLTAPRGIFMHALPAHRGQEVAADVIDGPASAVWQQAANLLPVEQALLRALITNNWEA
jgi:ornithine carbamoyltransferase